MQSNEALITALRDAFQQNQLTVTTLHIEQLSSEIGDVKSSLTLLKWGVGLALGLLLSTYGATAFFTWRLVSLLAQK